MLNLYAPKLPEQKQTRLEYNERRIDDALHHQLIRLWDVFWLEYHLITLQIYIGVSSMEFLRTGGFAKIACEPVPSS